MDLTLRRREYTTFPRIGEIRDWGVSAYQNQLTELLELLDSLFEDVLDAVDHRDPRATLQTSEGIRSQEFGPCGSRDMPGGNQSVAVQRVPRKQDRGSQT
jgi:hypothetical protein